MDEDLGTSIARIEPLADAVVEAATALNATVRAAAEQGLSVRLDLSEDAPDPDAEPIPVLRARILKRIG